VDGGHEVFGGAGFILFPLFIVGLYGALGLGVIVHELGHALVALLLTQGTVTIEIGQGDKVWAFRAGRLRCVVRRESGAWGLAHGAVRGWHTGLTRLERDEEIGTGRQVAIILAGPLATLVIAALAVALLAGFAGYQHSPVWLLPDLLLAGFAVCEGAIFVGNLLPWQFRRPRRDGATGTDGFILLLLLSPGRLRRFLLPRSHRLALSADGRSALVAAEQMAASRGAEAVAPLHLLYGTIEGSEDVVRIAMAVLNDDVAHIRCMVAESLGPETGMSTTRSSHGLGLSGATAEAIRQATTEALRCGHKQVGTAHLLLGLLIVEDDAVAGILREGSLTIETARASVAALPGYSIPATNVTSM